MKMSWMSEGRTVLRFEAENETDLSVLGALYMNSPLAGAAPLYVHQEDAPAWGRSPQHGLRSHIGGTRLLVGLEWDIRNQPNVGAPVSDADARVAQATQPVGQALHQLGGSAELSSDARPARASCHYALVEAAKSMKAVVGEYAALDHLADGQYSAGAAQAKALLARVLELQCSTDPARSRTC